MKISLISVDNDIISHGVRSLSAFLKNNGYNTKVIFLPLGLNDKIYSAKILDSVLDIVKNDDLVGITSMTLTEPRARQVIEHLRNNDIKVIFGGIHTTIMPEEAIKYVDMLCIGEGEQSFLELVKHMDNGKDYSNIPNLWIKNENKVSKNPVDSLVDDLDFFGVPDYDIKNHYYLKQDQIIKFPESAFNGMHSIHTMRGCPHACTYCTNNFFRVLYKGKGKIIRKRSINNILSELSLIRRKFKSIKRVWITDDTFIYRPEKELKEFVKKYKAKIKLPFGCFFSPKTITKDKLDLLIKGGLDTVILGVQTGSDRIQKELYKRTSLQSDVMKAAKLLKKYQNKIEVSYQFIITNPYEKEEDLLQTIALIKRLPKPFILATFNLAFLRGTELYKKAKQDGVIKNEKDAATDLHFYDLIGHLKRKKTVNYYLNSILFSMNGNNTKKRYGFVPAVFLDFLIDKRVIWFNNTFKLPIYVFNRFRKFVVFVTQIGKKKVVSA